MANLWLRLWHDMPNDPKWRTIARISGQSIATVQAVYLQLLVDASRNVTRGHVTVTKEDIASALDVTEVEVDAVLQAMQGRVLDEDRLTGWDSRQPAREDDGDPISGAKSATQRKREQRERARSAREDAKLSRDVTIGHEESRNVTTDKDKEEIKKEEPFTLPAWINTETWKAYLEVRKTKRAAKTIHAWNLIVKQLDSFRSKGHDPNAILETSIRSNWTDVYEPKDKSQAVVQKRVYIA